jgi:hypothetical protein
MVFPHAGENHVNGIINEKFVVDYLNQNPANEINTFLKNNSSNPDGTSSVASDIVWRHEGGTQQKADCVAQIGEKSLELSIKNHKSGTHDWINKSNDSEELKTAFAEFKQKHAGKEATPAIRSELNVILANWMNQLTSDQIRGILASIYDPYPDYIIVNRVSKKQLTMFHKSKLEPYFKPAADSRFILKSTARAVTSKQIWLVTADGTEINTHLRIRSVTNNGVNALLGKKGAVACIKIQQENVDKFIDSCVDNVSCSY